MDWKRLVAMIELISRCHLVVSLVWGDIKGKLPVGAKTAPHPEYSVGE